MRSDFDGPLQDGIDELHPLAMAVLDAFFGQERLHDLLGLLEIGLPGAQRQHVGVVVLAAVLRQGDIVTGRRAHPAHLVGGHRRADARAVNHDAAIALPAGDQARDGVRNARVINSFLAVRPAILDRTSLVP